MAKKGFKALLAEANAVIESVSVHDAMAVHGAGDAVFVDVREAHEHKAEGIPGAVSAPRGYLEFMADPESPLHKQALASGRRLIVYCATGGRSTLAVKTLHDMGLTNAVNMVGGIAAWKEAGGPVKSS